MMNPKPVLFLMLLWISVLVLLQGCALVPTATTTAPHQQQRQQLQHQQQQ